MKSALVFLCVASAAAAAPFGFPRSQATGNAQGTVTEGQSYGPQGSSHIISTGSVAGGTSINGAPSFSTSHASNLQGVDGTSLSNTGATSIQPGSFGAGLFGGGFSAAPFGAGFGGQATGNAQGTVTEGQSFGPQGSSHITNTGSVAGGTSINGAPNFSTSHSSNLQGVDGTSLSNTGATSIQPGSFGAGLFGGGFSGAPYRGAFRRHFGRFGGRYGGRFSGFGR